MSDNSVLFDARDGASSLIGPIGLLFFLVVATLIVRYILNPTSSRGGDPTVNSAVGVLMLLIVAAVLVASSLPFFIGLRARAAIANGKVSIWQGCVRGLEQQVHHEDHDLTDTYFSVSGKSFHFNSSPWLPGFHNEGSVVQSGDGLRITTSGDTVLQIKRAPRACPAHV